MISPSQTGCTRFPFSNRLCLTPFFPKSQSAEAHPTLYAWVSPGHTGHTHSPFNDRLCLTLFSPHGQKLHYINAWISPSHTGYTRFPFSNGRLRLTLCSKSFSPFPQGTCVLSVSDPYLASGEIRRVPSLERVRRQIGPSKVYSVSFYMGTTLLPSAAFRCHPPPSARTPSANCLRPLSDEIDMFIKGQRFEWEGSQKMSSATGAAACKFTTHLRSNPKVH